MNLLNSLNALSKVLLGVGIVTVWKQASQSKAAAQKAEQLARDKYLKEAAITVEKTLTAWSSTPNFWERLLRRWLLGNLLEQLKLQLGQWHSQISEADKLAAKAKALLKKDTGNPLEGQALSQVIALYQRCTEIVHDEATLRAINHCQQELQKRQQFQKLVTWADTQVEQQFFKQAIATYREAEQLYPTEAVISAITTCSAQFKHQKTYEADLQRAQQGFREGRLRGAITLLESALTNFPRSDGTELLEQLQRTVKGREKFRQGLNAEQLGAFKGAAFMYEEAKVLLSDPTECQIRLGLVAIKTEEWAITQSHLEGVRGNQAAYLRGFAYAKQDNLQQAQREWQPLPQSTIESQREILKSLAQRQRLLTIQNIEQLVRNENLEEAKAVSTTFFPNFGSDSLVEYNLDEYIQPRLETAVWQRTDWGTITDTVEQIWIEQPNLTSLHNWAVATYYYALVEPIETRDFGDLEYLIIALSTALANLRQDPALQNVPWLGNTPVDYDSVSSDLVRRIEEAIDSHKNKDFNEYLKLRDRYRLEMVTLRMMGDPPLKGLRVQGVFITPGCYELQRENLKGITFPAKPWGTLYTRWGLAVAACIEGDTQRAIQLKPSTKTSGEVELFAQKFVAYNEGCYYLQQQEWRDAKFALKQAKAEIKASTDWRNEVDRLCGVQRQALSEFKEHLEFAQFWYELLGSQPSKSYLAEYKAEQIRVKLAKEQITFSQALQELKALKQIDTHSPVVLDLIERIELSQELEEIQRLFSNRQFEEMVSRAKRSRHERVHYIVAEFIIEILVNAINNGDLNNPEVMQQLGRWAYEICPNEPAFQQVYRTLRLCY